MGYTGTRWAETIGLHRRNINPLRRRVHIETTLSEVAGVFHVVPPKTWQEREIVLDGSLADTLGEHLASYTDAAGDALVFTTDTGAPIRASNFRRRQWTPALEAAGVEPMTLHELRHTAASMMAEAGWTLQAVQGQLGHSSITVTSDTYSHLFDEAVEAMADRLEHLHTG
jgi:integrase